ncbi:CDP-paratose 2-epimerase [Methylobrevis pamukkalensis]|uniref:UDP-glucose 4-epimerase n=1 Tax=Methylobrevis pamukkalensis TaxID=1439726 RepID=A0A1E3H260_9HYPH|nr:CDP-paratose 2-epimerase [Methylobrevis pamukkalensis]
MTMFPHPAIRPLAGASITRRSQLRRPVLITGGCGFIGARLAESYLAEGEEVLLLDNLSRPGAAAARDGLIARHGTRVQLLSGDLRDEEAVRRAVRESRAVIHLGAQTAVAASLDRPLADFDITRGARSTCWKRPGSKAAGSR